MYRVLVNIDDKPVNRVFIENARDMWVITRCFIQLATGHEYKLLGEYNESDFNSIWNKDSFYHYEVEGHTVIFRIKNHDNG